MLHTRVGCTPPNAHIVGARIARPEPAAILAKLAVDAPYAQRGRRNALHTEGKRTRDARPYAEWYRRTPARIGTRFVGLGQHRTIWQAHSAKDFASYESYKRAGILYVFPPFITARMGQKIGRRPQTQLCGDALEKVYHIPGEMETFSLGTAKMGLTAGVGYGIMASPVKKGLFFLPFSFRGNSISLPGCGREAKLRRCRTCASKSL